MRVWVKSSENCSLVLQNTNFCTIVVPLHLTFLTHSYTMTPFDAPGEQAFENTMGKVEIARDEQFLLFP